MNNVTLNENFYALIRECEGCRLQAYRCPSGVMTIGYGHTEGVVAGMTISQQQADRLLQDDAACAMVDVLRVLPEVSGDQLAALASLAYNIGPGNFHKSTLVKTIQRTPGNIKEIHKQWRRWIYSRGKVLNGLKTRREKELKLYFGSKYIPNNK